MANNKRKLVCLKDIKANIYGTKNSDILCCAHCRDPRLVSWAVCEKLEANKKWHVGTAKRLVDARRAVQNLKHSLRTPVEDLPVAFPTHDEAVQVQNHRRRFAWWLSTMVWQLDPLKRFRIAEQAMGVGPAVHEYKMEQKKMDEWVQRLKEEMEDLWEDEDNEDNEDDEDDDELEEGEIAESDGSPSEESEVEDVDEMAPMGKLDANAIPPNCFPKYRFLPNEIKQRIFSFLARPPPCHHVFRAIVCHYGHLDIDMTSIKTRTLIFQHHPAAELMPDRALWTATSASRATMQLAYDKWARRMSTDPYCDNDDRVFYPQPGDMYYESEEGRWRDELQEARFDNRGAGIYSQYTTGKHWRIKSLVYPTFHLDNGQDAEDDSDGEEEEEGVNESESEESESTLQGDDADNSSNKMTVEADEMQVDGVNESREDDDADGAHDSDYDSDTESGDDDTVKEIMHTPYETPDDLVRPFIFDLRNRELFPDVDKSDDIDDDNNESINNTPTAPQCPIPEWEKQWRENNILDRSCFASLGDMHPDRIDKYNTPDEMDLTLDEAEEDEIDDDHNVNFDPIVREPRQRRFKLPRQDVEDYDSDADADFFQHVKKTKTVTTTTPSVTRQRARDLLRRHQRRAQRKGQPVNTDEAYDSDADTESDYGWGHDMFDDDYFSEEHPIYDPGIRSHYSGQSKYHFMEQFVQQTRSMQDWILGIDGMDRNAVMYFSINHTYLTERERRMLLRAKHLYKSI